MNGTMPASDNAITLYQAPPQTDWGCSPPGPEAVPGNEGHPWTPRLRMPQVEVSEPGAQVVIHNAFHDTSTKCTVRKNGTISARTYRRICRSLCEAVTTKDACGCDGPNGDPDYAFIPVGRDTATCEWQVCRRPAKQAKSSVGRAVMATGGFLFGRAVPYAIAGLVVYGGAVLQLAISACTFGIKWAIIGTILAYCVYNVLVVTAIF